ncbi:hypothetical protein AB0M34_28145 [Nocardia sp. NPDC050193]
MTIDPYLDPESGVLRNRLGITNEEKLHRAEADLTYAAVHTDPGTKCRTE